MGDLFSKCYNDHTVQSTDLSKPTENVNLSDENSVTKSKIKSNQNYLPKETNNKQIKTQLLEPSEYLISLNIKQSLRKEMYRKFTDFEISNEHNHREIQISQCAYLLNHKRLPIGMSEFLKYNWKIVQKIDFTKCLIDDSQWRLFVSKAHLFPNLKILRLDQNQISAVHQGDLEGFSSLRNISFGDYGMLLSNVDFIANPLTRESANCLARFQKKHTNPKFWLEYLPQ